MGHLYSGDRVRLSRFVRCIGHIRMECDDGFQISPDIEISDHFDEVRSEKFFQVPINFCSRFFMGYADVPKTVQIEFQGFEFDDVAGRTKPDPDHREIRITGPWTQARELGERHLGFIRDVRGRVRPAFQLI